MQLLPQLLNSATHTPESVALGRVLILFQRHVKMKTAATLSSFCLRFCIALLKLRTLTLEIYRVLISEVRIYCRSLRGVPSSFTT
jgi:hypothetical protein